MYLGSSIIAYCTPEKRCLPAHNTTNRLATSHEDMGSGCQHKKAFPIILDLCCALAKMLTQMVPLQASETREADPEKQLHRFGTLQKCSVELTLHIESLDHQHHQPAGTK